MNRPVMKLKRTPFMNAVLTHAKKSVTELAVKAGVSATTLYSALNKGRTSLETLSKLCAVIGGEPADFIEDEFKQRTQTVFVDAAALEALRIRYYLTQKALAAEVGISKSEVQYIKRHGRTSQRTLNKLAAALEVEPKELLAKDKDSVAIDAAALEDLRIRYGLTQKALAAEVGISKSGFGYIKRYGRTSRRTNEEILGANKKNDDRSRRLSGAEKNLKKKP